MLSPDTHSPMPTVAETITIPAPPDQVWPLLSDPATVASCIPGATLSAEKAGDAWKGSIRVKFGPTVAIFKGEALLRYDHTARTVTIEGRGIDGRGASRALATGLVAASGTDETTLAVSGDYSVSGPLETFANAGGVHVARALLAEFAKNMGALVASRAPGGPALPRAEADAPMRGHEPAATAIAPAVTAPANDTMPAAPARQAAPPAPAAELNAFALLWAAFKSWAASLFTNRR